MNDRTLSAVRMAAEGLLAVAGGDLLLASSQTDCYGRLFGRDSLITSLQFLSAVHLDPSLGSLLLPVVGRTLRALASLQGVMSDPWTEEEPGKILHEFNAHGGGDFPGAYYASVDSTPLFLMALHRFDTVTRGRGDRETGRTKQDGQDRKDGQDDTDCDASSCESFESCPSCSIPVSASSLLRELRDTRDRALDWIIHRADLDGDGLVEFLQRNPEGKSLMNQNWKDSRDSLLEPNGGAPLYPVAYAEVQAYCYRAVVGEAELRRREDPARAAELLIWADRLARRFERLFWMPEAGCYAQALDARKRQLGDVASNAFHWLWLGPVRPRRFRRAALRLLAPDMMTPFGLRTLSSASPNYAPLRYHRGTIWPWDNWAAASALRRLGLVGQAKALDAAVLRALNHLGCPAELYVYHDGDPAVSMDFRDWWGRPTRSCRLQAWTVGYLVEMLARRGMGMALLQEMERQQAAVPPQTIPASSTV